MSFKAFTAVGMALAVVCTVPVAAFAGPQPASVYIVHGIPGRDVAATLDPLLPVDVSVNGKCLLQGLNFGDIKGPYQIPAGTYTVKVGLADTLSPCSSNAVINAPVNVKAGKTAAVVAALSPAGAPTAYPFGIDLSTVDGDKNRILVAHAAKAPSVNVVLSKGTNVVAKVTNLAPGKAFNNEVPADSYHARIKPSGSNKVVLGPIPLALPNKGSTLVFAVGSASSGSLTLLTKNIPNVF